jgi:hypothetical protein
VVRPVVESHGWDHEAGIESFSLEKGFVVKNSIPANISGQVRASHPWQPERG